LREVLAKIADSVQRGIGPQDLESVSELVKEASRLMRPQLIAARQVPGQPDVQEADEWTWPVQPPDSPETIVAFLQAVHLQLAAVEETLGVFPPSTRFEKPEGHDHVSDAPPPSRADGVLERILEAQGLVSTAAIADFRVHAGLDREADKVKRTEALDRVKKRRRRRGRGSLGPLLDYFEHPDGRRKRRK
jgi:hypothetical protein